MRNAKTTFKPRNLKRTITWLPHFWKNKKSYVTRVKELVTKIHITYWHS